MRKKTQYIVVNEIYKTIYCGYPRKRAWKIITGSSGGMLLTGIACRKNKVPYAVNITGLGTAFQKQGLVKNIVVFLYKIALRKAKVVFFENSGNRDIFVESHIIKKEQACLLNGAGVNLDQYKYLSYPGDESIFKFLFIGRVMKWFVKMYIKH